MTGVRATLSAACVALLLLAGGCAPRALLEGAGVVVYAPAARSALDAYLPPAELARLAPATDYLDRLYARALAAADTPADAWPAELRDALATVRGIDAVSDAYLEIADAVAAHERASGRPVPVALVLFDRSARARFEALRDVVASRDRALALAELALVLEPLARGVAR